MLQVYLSIIILIVAGLVAYMILYAKPIEGFDATGQLFEQGTDARLGQPQVFVSVPIPSDMMQSAMGMPSTLPGLIGTSTTVNPNTALINITAGQNALAQQSAQCRAIRRPSAIIRTSGQTVSCGWLFPPGLSAGFAAIGTEIGPITREHQQLVHKGRYVWQWDPVQAQIEEDKRECARITSCTSITGTGCGWCATSNTAVPINLDGSLKYAAATPCAILPITNIGSCPVSQKTVASPAVDGSCGPGCIRDAILIKGCDIGGVLAATLSAGKPVANLPQVQDLAARNFMLSSKILTDSTPTQSEALQEVTQIVQGRTSADRVVAQATASLCTGGIPYDICSASEDGTVIPRTECVKQIWQQAGCGPRGTSSPDSSPTTWKQYTTAPAVRQTVAGIVRDMTSTNVTTQQNAIKSCLGVSLVRPLAPKCTEPGVEVIYYDFTGWTFPPLRGREIVSDGFPNFDVENGYVLRSGRKDRVQLKIIGRIQPPPGQGGMQDIRVRSDDGIFVYVNGIRVIDAWREQGPTVYERHAILNADSNVSTKLEVTWYENYGGAVMQLWIADTGRGNFREIPTNWIYLTQSRTSAFLVWPFYNGTIIERRNLSKTSNTGNLSYIGSGPGRSLVLGNDNFVSFDQMLPLDQITAIAINVYMEPAQPSAPNEHGLILLEFGTVETGRLTIHYVENAWRVMYSDKNGSTQIGVSGAMRDQWTRLVFVIADDSKSATLYVNGKGTSAVGQWNLSSVPTIGVIGKTSLTQARANYRISVMAIYDYDITAEMLLAGAQE